MFSTNSREKIYIYIKKARNISNWKIRCGGESDKMNKISVLSPIESGLFSLSCFHHRLDTNRSEKCKKKQQQQQTETWYSIESINAFDTTSPNLMQWHNSHKYVYLYPERIASLAPPSLARLSPYNSMDVVSVVFRSFFCYDCRCHCCRHCCCWYFSSDQLSFFLFLDH